MTANLLFSQTTSQTHLPGLESGKMGTSFQDRATARKTTDAYSGNDGESFLNTMKQIAKDLNPRQPSRVTREVKSTETHTSDSVGKLDAGDYPAGTLELGTFEQTPSPVDALDNAELQMPHAFNFLEIIDTLEKLGFLNSAGGASSSNNADGMLIDEAGRTTLKMLMTRLGQNDFVPSAEMKAELDRLLQLMASFQTGNGLSHNHGNPVADLTDSRSATFPDLDQMLKRTVSSQEELSGRPDSRMGESDAGENPSGPSAKMNTVATTLQTDTRQTGFLQAAGDSQLASRLENQEKADSLKLAAEVRTVGAEIIKNAQGSRSLETFDPDDSGRKDDLDTPSKTRVSSQTGLLKRNLTTIDSGKQLSGESAPKNFPNHETASVIKMTNDAQTAKVSQPEHRHDADPVQNNAVNNVSSPVSKIIHDSILAKENQIRMNATLSDELGGKVTKVDAGTNDNGLLSSQNQNADKAFEATALSKQVDAGQDSLRNQALDQIVRKAVIYMRNGQHEAKIDLKPEFLGHVRMQVTTENHQVTIKILTEFGFVKDMVENNIQQLKADLQQQGLNVDKLEVTVFNDADGHKHRQQKAGQAKNRQHNATRIGPENGEEDTREQTGNFGLRDADAVAVDYFA
jgi:flagellar hook-length control protein FliK